MPGSRALKEQTTCKSHKSGGKESAPKGNSKQYTHSGPKYTGPNYPQWKVGSNKGTIKGI